MLGYLTAARRDTKYLINLTGLVACLRSRERVAGISPCSKVIFIGNFVSAADIITPILLPLAGVFHFYWFWKYPQTYTIWNISVHRV